MADIKIAHFVWTGSPIPLKYLSALGYYAEAHPGWDVVLWVDRGPVPYVKGIWCQQVPEGDAKAVILAKHGGVMLEVEDLK